MSEKARVQINYKSGISMVVEVDEDFTVKRHPANGLGVEWGEISPYPMFLGVGDIESIWELP